MIFNIDVFSLVMARDLELAKYVFWMPYDAPNNTMHNMKTLPIKIFLFYRDASSLDFNYR
jgi:hypothetical protein